MRIASVPKWKFAEVVIENSVWGSNRSRFGKWELGETLVILVAKEGIVVAAVTGEGFLSDQMIWEEDLYEYRIPVRIEKVLRGGAGKAAAAAVRQVLSDGLGTYYGVYIMSQSKLPEEVEKLVRKTF
jgi:hypothetical protein